MNRLFLFLGTNIAVIFILGLVMEVFGLRGLLDEQGVVSTCMPY